MKKQVFIFDHVIYRAPLEKKAYWYMLRRQPKLGKYIFVYLFYTFLRLFGVISREKYLAKRWGFLKGVRNRDEMLDRFARQHGKNLLKPAVWQSNGECCWVSEHPAQVIRAFAKGQAVRVLANAYDCDKQEYESFSSLNARWQDLAKADPIYLYDRVFHREERVESFVTYRGKLYAQNQRLIYVVKRILWGLFTVAAFLGLSFIVCICGLYFSTSSYGWTLFADYFRRFTVVLLNMAPILILWLFLTFLSGRVWVGFLCSSLLAALLSLFNFFKLAFRNDPVLFSDVRLLFESVQMAGKYEVNISRSMILFFAGIAVATAFLAYLYRGKCAGGRVRLIGIVASLILILIAIPKVYLSSGVYAYVEETSGITKRWSATDHYVSRGFVYPFLKSMNDDTLKKPAGYHQEQAEQDYFSYKYDDIPEDRKVNVISIMLEAYNDFSKFDGVSFATDSYAYWHQLAEESYSGELVTNIFAGGTVDTERSFLTGYTTLQNFRADINSYVHYFNEQGYTTEGNHPSYNWFYNRLNINQYLGFSDYHFYEDRYEAMVGEQMAPDEVFLPDIVDSYEANKVTGKPYFNFSVTYQNHGPYPDVPETDTTYLNWQEGYNESDYHIWNNYFAGIASTNAELEKMITTLAADEEPVVVILFGDHNPWGGDNNSAYNMLGIDFDLSTEEGFYQYYNTPYLIWANDAAKKTLDQDFIGKGGSIGPYFLMNRFFSLAGYEGDEYMKITNELLDAGIDVVHDLYKRENGVLQETLSDTGQQALDRFLRLQYYRMTNFIAERSRS